MIEPKSRRTVEQAVIRGRLREPVRLYLYPVAVLQLVAAVILGLVSGDWSWTLPGLSFAVVTVCAAECVRVSVFSEAGHFQSLHAAASRWAEITRAPQ